MVDVRPAQALQPRWARARRVTLWSCWAQGATRAEASGLARCVTELLISYKNHLLYFRTRVTFLQPRGTTHIYLVIYREIYLKRVREGKHKPEEKV